MVHILFVNKRVMQNDCDSNYVSYDKTFAVDISVTNTLSNGNEVSSKLDFFLPF